MRQHNCKLPLMALLVLCVATPTLGRRVRVSRPVAPAVAEDQEPRAQQIQYYTAEEAAAAERAGGQLVLVNDDAAYQGLYGRQALERQSNVGAETYRPRSGQIVPGSKPASRIKEAPRAPPVQTLSNYNKVNDDGSFTFGYEAADGSFKEETRGTDCVVRGKYGYVDPDGNKREFTYVSGNPCDPNAAKEEEEEEKINGALDDSGEENVPKGPIRPLRPRPIAAARPTTTVFQNNYVQDEENEDAGPQQVLYRTTPRLVTQRPTVAYEPQQVVTPRPTVRAQPAVRITPRPYSASTTVRSQLPATTYRPSLHASPTPAPRPGVIYSNSAQPTSIPHAATAAVDFDETLRQFQLEHNVVSTPRSVAPRPQAIPRPQQEHLGAAKPTGNALYETQLVYDPASGQYQTVFYQNIPQNDISQRHRLQPFGSQPTQQQLIQQQRQQQIALQQQRQQLPQQQAYQQQQANVLQQSQALYAQQQQQQQRQRALALQQQQQQQPAAAQQSRFTQFQSPTQRYPLQQQYYQQQALQKEPSRQYYYVSPSDDREGIAHGQIDAFLRTHNIAY